MPTEMTPKYKRCIYPGGDNGIPCESLFQGEGDLCPVHIGFISAPLASNGTNKDSYIAKRNNAMFSVIEAIRGMSNAEALAFCDSNLARIEQALEDQKIIALAWRGKKGELLDGLTEEERKERRKIRTPKLEKVVKVNAARELSAAMIQKEKAIASLMKTGKTREQAVKLVEMD